MQVLGERQALAGVERYRRRLEQTIYTTAQEIAREVTAWEKANHPWQNRTGEAERTIHCIAVQEGPLIGLENRHIVFYGKFLELRNEGRFAILQTALRRFWAEWRRRIVVAMMELAEE